MSSSYLQIRSETWNRDSYALFDYDCSKVIRQDIKAESSGLLIRKGNFVSFASSEDLNLDLSELVKIYENGGEFIISPLKVENTGIVINKYKSKNKRGYALSEGETLKFGKAKLKIKKIHKISEDSALNPEEIKDEFEGSNAGDDTCRICFRTHSNSIDPLLSICNCVGSMGLIHLKCLQKWLLVKASVKSNTNCLTYRWKTLKCDICKEKYPFSVKIDEQKYEIVSVPKPNSDYMILQDYRNTKYEYILHVLSFNHSPLLIGRSADTDVKINDISVSRSHATIEYFENRFYLKDCGSKFGTIVILKKPVIVSKGQDLAIQVSRSVLYFKVKTKFLVLESLKNCCKKYNKVDPVPRSRTEIVWEEESLRSAESPV